MPRVRAIHLSAVKSLRLVQTERAELTQRGIAGDRAFVVLDARNQVATLRKHGWMAQVGSRYDPRSGLLELELPDGDTIGGTVEEDGTQTVVLFGRILRGTVVAGPWAEALSAIAGAPMRLLRVEDGAAQDAHPVSMLGQESVEELARRSGLDEVPDPRRFRNTLLVEGCRPHAEDEWIGERVRAGDAVLRVIERDPRCSLTTRNPNTGRRDLDTLRLIAGYRPLMDGEICFGVYAEVEQPGMVAVGDLVEPLAKGAP
jgi:MOSC domain-containing protein